MENVMSEHKKADWRDEWEREEKVTDDGKAGFSGQEEDCRSQSLRSQVREEHSMNNDVEALHSEGDEPDLVQYLKGKRGE